MKTKWIIIGVVIVLMININLQENNDTKKQSHFFVIYEGTYEQVKAELDSQPASYCKASTKPNPAFNACITPFHAAVGTPYAGFKANRNCGEITGEAQTVYSTCFPLGCDRHAGLDICNSGNVYWTDSCGGLDGVKETCSFGCTGGICDVPDCPTLESNAFDSITSWVTEPVAANKAAKRAEAVTTITEWITTC